ncbi:hypothetical protein [Erythrobacter sp. R86502]|uniref:hypothetical protein n=1 Tax=Erythrobacter sp. R86502 TaxID=3093846 RepID=UPI0036D31660
MTQDPVIARALHDPLMSDPDLASVNPANAALGFVDSAALPVFAVNRETTDRAREALRLELLNDGPIPDLPAAEAGSGGKILGPMTGATELLAAVGAPPGCVDLIEENFAYAASLPRVAAVPPRGMVSQAGGVDAPGCRVRILRYQTAALPDDVLLFHYTRAVRAGLRAKRFATPGQSIAAFGGDGETMVAHVRMAANGLTGITLVYRAPSTARIRVADRP